MALHEHRGSADLEGVPRDQGLDVADPFAVEPSAILAIEVANLHLLGPNRDRGVTA